MTTTPMSTPQTPKHIMKKILMTLAAILCCAMTTTVVNAQITMEQALKYAEKKVKLADKNPKNGKMQCEAAMAFISDEMGEKKDLDRALTYANRALKIATEQPAPKDTLLGLTCYALSMIYMQKQDTESAMNYLEKAMDGFEVELGRDDPVTNGTKLVHSWLMMTKQPLRAFPKIQEAFFDNSIAPQDKRIENMDEANIVQEMALEILIAEQTQRFRYALPMIFMDGKRYFIVQTKDWNMERPLVGWLVPSLLHSEAEGVNDATIICDDNLQFTVMSEEDKDKRQLTFNFTHEINNPRKLETNEGDARIWFLSPESYENLLAKFRAFKAEKK